MGIRDLEVVGADDEISLFGHARDPIVSSDSNRSNIVEAVVKRT